MQQPLQALALDEPTRPRQAKPLRVPRPRPSLRVPELGRLDEAGDDLATDDDPVPPERRQPAGEVPGDADRFGADARSPVPTPGRDLTRAPRDVAEPGNARQARQPGRQQGIRRRHLEPQQVGAVERLAQDRPVRPQETRHRPEISGDPVERRRSDDPQSLVERQRRRRLGGIAERHAVHDLRDRVRPGRPGAADRNRWNVALTGWTRPSQRTCGLSSSTTIRMPT